VISPRSPGCQASVKPSATERLDRQVIEQKPDLLVIAYGLNDMRAGMSPEAFRGELEAVITRVRRKMSPMIVLTNVYHVTAYEYYPPFDRGSLAATRNYNRMLREATQANACVYADVWSAEGQCAHVVHQDTVHANKLGSMLIANKVFQAIVHAAPGPADNVRGRDARTAWTRQCLAQQSKGVEGGGTSRPGR